MKLRRFIHIVALALALVLFILAMMIIIDYRCSRNVEENTIDKESGQDIQLPRGQG
jgi:hypothetical protein